jgi:hypothetical protein
MWAYPIQNKESMINFTSSINVRLFIDFEFEKLHVACYIHGKANQPVNHAGFRGFAE